MRRCEFARHDDHLMQNLSVGLVIAVIGGTVVDSLVAGAATPPNSLTMTCAQVQAYIKKHGQTLLTTGRESGNYSFDYADCGGTVPGYVQQVIIEDGWRRWPAKEVQRLVSEWKPSAK
jgi:hypothetical protein